MFSGSPNDGRWVGASWPKCLAAEGNEKTAFDPKRTLRKSVLTANDLCHGREARRPRLQRGLVWADRAVSCKISNALLVETVGNQTTLDAGEQWVRRP